MDTLFDGLSLKNVPVHAIYVLLGLIGLGVYWKKNGWPTKYYGIVNLLLGIVAYPALELNMSDKPYQDFRNPMVILGMYGAAIAISTTFLYGWVISALKKRLPMLDIPTNGSGGTTTITNKPTDPPPAKP